MTTTPAFITLEYARLQVSVEDRDDFDDYLKGIVWIASQIVANHCKIDEFADIPAAWFSDTAPDLPEDYILPKMYNNDSPPILQYLIPPGAIQQAVAAQTAQMFMDREKTGIPEWVMTLLEPYRDPTAV